MSKTKAEVLAAANDLKDTVKFPEHDWEPEVRSLTDAEFAKAQAILLNGQQISASRSEIERGEGGEQVLMNLSGLIEGEFDSRVFVCSRGMTDGWNEGEVRKIPYPGAIARISDAILKLGGHDLYEGLEKGVRHDVSSFRSKSRRARDSRASDHGDSAGEESAGDDNDSEVVSADSSPDSLAANTG